jgi:hypothetical protein
LSERVDACCDHHQMLLRYVSGDAQQAAPGVELTDPLVVEVVDGNGHPVPNETVTFQIRGGGGALAPVSLASGADGQAATRWKLGPGAGLNTMAASIAGAAELPMFALAVVQQPPVTTPPVVMHIWPDSALQLSPADQPTFNDWMQRPIIAITFDRKMRIEQLQDAVLVNAWLRVAQLRLGDLVAARPVNLRFADVSDTFHNRTGSTAIFELELDNRDVPARYVIQMRADSGNITDTSTPPMTLDAEFVGTRLTAAVLTQLWGLSTETQMPRTVWNGLIDTGATLPHSGDGTEGGNFASWFEVAPQT